ncbi:SAM-dependent methyltransferase [Actinosynnema sp. NPDC059335]|uniref:SAM-dependent methyltransferase n=1 Tax=Actinosynnema sp. NPDC059335 TaxID=3346804 RepID=UPI00366B5D00
MSDRAAQTAVGPMVIVAVEQAEDRPLVRDELAGRLLPAVGRVAVACARWRPVRRALIAATEKKVPGLWAGVLCRKRYIDDRVRAALTTGIEAVVVLGAGFDTRAHRIARPAGASVYEVDLPVNVERKRALIARLGAEVSARVTLVPVDFGTQDLGEVLAQRGYRRGQRTLFVWEAVTQYLDEPGVRATFDFLAEAAPGSELVFTYVRRDFLDGTSLYGAQAAHREFVSGKRLWRFGLAPDKVEDFLAPYGWAAVEQVGPAEYDARYLRPAGRALPVSEIERCVLAVKT